MPVISRFYGIAIRMFFAKSLMARFHAIYCDYELVVGIQPVSIIQGEAPLRVRQMVLEWATQHEGELMEAWNSCRFASPPRSISPLE